MTGRERTCPECGADFRVKYDGAPQVYCSRSCGARVRARARLGTTNSNWRGGKTKHPLYQCYMDMIGRCHRPTHLRYRDYGGRGISVCDRWRLDFWAYVSDVGERPIGLSLDRRDNDGDYTPENCHWATASEQNKNRRDSAYDGVRRRNASKVSAA